MIITLHEDDTGDDCGMCGDNDDGGHFDEITVLGHSYLSKLARPQSQRSLQEKVSRNRNGSSKNTVLLPLWRQQ